MAGEPRRLNQPYTAEQLRQLLNLGGGGLELEMVQLVRPVVVVGTLEQSGGAGPFSIVMAQGAAAGEEPVIIFPASVYLPSDDQGKRIRLRKIIWTQASAARIEVAINDTGGLPFPLNNSAQIKGRDYQNPAKEGKCSLARGTLAGGATGQGLVIVNHAAGGTTVIDFVDGLAASSPGYINISNNVPNEQAIVSLLWDEIDA